MPATRKPARFGKATKAAKAIAATPEMAVDHQQEQNTMPTPSSSICGSPKRPANFEIVVTPSKRRKLQEERTSASKGSKEQTAEDAIVTPTKNRTLPTSTNVHFLPTPPVTPTISISEHEEANDDAESPTCVSPTASTSSLTPSPPSSLNNANIYARARSLLRLSAHQDATTSSQSLVGRDSERQQLDAFLRCHLHQLYPDQGVQDGESVTQDSQELLFGKGKGKAKALYISGSPGTGKTALLHNVIAELTTRARKTDNVALAVLNCTTVKRAEDVWARLAEELDLSPNRGKGKNKAKWTLETFKEALEGSESPARQLVVLDEIDHLLPATQGNASTSNSSSVQILSDLFKLALDPSSNLVLIGIANALDLTQRYHAALFGSTDDEASINTARLPQVELLHFRPFQADEMVAIVKQRLGALHGIDGASQPLVATPTLPVIMPAALELAAKKVAAVTGDLRSFLSLIRKAVEIFETEQRKRVAANAPSTTETAVSPTKNIRASQRSKSRKSSLTREGEEGVEAWTDPLAHFDARTAPKLTPAHILKATRLVSITSSSSASSAGSAGQGINSSAGSLSATSSSASSLLQSKISELNLHQRITLSTFLVLLARRVASGVPTWALEGNTTTIDIDAEAASPGTGAAKTSELFALYKTLLSKEDVLHPVSHSEFSDLISGLHTRGLIGFEKDIPRAPSSQGSPSLAPPMMRRTSSSSSVGSASGSSPSGSRSSRSPSPNSATKNGAQAPLYLLYPFTSLYSVLSATSSTSSATEASSICANMLSKENKRLKRIRLSNEQAAAEKKEREFAPREGFKGDGLEDDAHRFVGKRDRRASRHETEEDDQDDDHEKKEAKNAKAYDDLVA